MFSTRKSVTGKPPSSPIPASPSASSPRQIATRAYNLACKKLERDEKRSKPTYMIRERLLLYRTMVQAEEVLQKRTRRTIRRVMDAEEDEESFTIGKPSQAILLGTPAKLIWSTMDDEGVDPDQKLSEERLHETAVVPFSERRHPLVVSASNRKPSSTREPRIMQEVVTANRGGEPTISFLRHDCNLVNRNSPMPNGQPKSAVLAQ